MGWTPDSTASRLDDQRSCVAECGTDAHGVARDLTLSSLEQIVQRVANDTSHSTTNSRKHSDRKVPEDIVAAKHAWKREACPNQRRELRKVFQTLRRKFDKIRSGAKLRSLASCKVHARILPTTLEVGPNIVTSSRTEWRDSAYIQCSGRYGDPENNVCAQREFIAGLDSAAQNSRLDGRPYPSLDFHVVMQTRSSMKPNTTPGTDGNVTEMWQALPLVLLITVWHLFRLRLASGSAPVNDDWRTIDLTGIPKLRRPMCIGDFRFIAKTPTLQKWYLKCILHVAMQSLPPSPLHVYGFRRGCCTGLVTELLRQSLHLAAQWAKPVYLMSLDIATAFDDMRHGQMAKSLIARGVHPNLVRAFMLEYLDLRARVKLADADPTDYFSYSKAGRQGGVETPELFNIMMEALASGLAVSWQERGF